MEATLITVSIAGKPDTDITQTTEGLGGIAGIVEALSEVNKQTNEHLTAIIQEINAKKS